MPYNRLLRVRLLAVILVLLFLALASVSTRAQAGHDTAPPGGDVYIIVFKDSVSDVRGTALALEKAHGLQRHFLYDVALKGMAATVPAGRLNGLAHDPRVAYVEADVTVSLLAQTIPTGVPRIFANSNPNLDIDGVDDYRVDVDVAVIDTGVYLHSDLNVYRRVSCTSWFSSSCSSGGDDGNGHGTHVAGTIGALDNSIGSVGIAPGARIWSVRVLNSSGSGQLSWIIAGINYVASNSASIEVANMSLGGEFTSASLNSAIATAVDRGVVFAVAAGNSDRNASTFSPANHPDVITVSALADFNGLAGGGAASTCRVDQDDTLADFSNWGSLVEIAAPGVCIYSTWTGGGYNTISGTSMASPHVAGAAAILAARSNPNTEADVFGIRNTLRNYGNYNWTDDSGDGVKEPLLDMSNSSVFDPTP